MGQAMANILGIQPDNFCTTVNQQSSDRYVRPPVSAAAQRSAAGSRRRSATNTARISAPDIPDVDGDNVADDGSAGRGSSSSSSSSIGPLEYVRVASTYGTGFYYIPGTDTCLRIGGYVRFQSDFEIGGGFDLGVGARAGLSLDTRTQTPFGTLRTYAMFNKFAGVDFGGGGINFDVEHWVDRAFFQLDGLNFGGRQVTATVGRLSSAFDAGPGHTYYAWPQSNATLFQVRGSFQTGTGLAVDLALERQEQRGIYGAFPFAFVAGFGPADTMAGAHRRRYSARPTVRVSPGNQRRLRLQPAAVHRGHRCTLAPWPELCRPLRCGSGLFFGGNISGRYQTAMPYDITGALGFAGGNGFLETNATIGIVRDLAPNVSIGAEISALGHQYRRSGAGRDLPPAAQFLAVGRSRTSR